MAPVSKAAISESDNSDESDDDPDCSVSEESDGYTSDLEEDVQTGKKWGRIPLSDDQLVHCSPLLKGYALKSKQWLEFFVDVVSEIKWNEGVFANLVLPEDQKELILAFAESQVKYKDKFDDVISGKGKGIILLLSGGPGIGKVSSPTCKHLNLLTIQKDFDSRIRRRKYEGTTVHDVRGRLRRQIQRSG